MFNLSTILFALWCIGFVIKSFIMKIEINNVDVKTCKGDLIKINADGTEELDVTINGKKIIKTKKTLWGKIKYFFNV